MPFHRGKQDQHAQGLVTPADTPTATQQTSASSRPLLRRATPTPTEIDSASRHRDASIDLRKMAQPRQHLMLYSGVRASCASAVSRACRSSLLPPRIEHESAGLLNSCDSVGGGRWWFTTSRFASVRHVRSATADAALTESPAARHSHILYTPYGPSAIVERANGIGHVRHLGSTRIGPGNANVAEGGVVAGSSEVIWFDRLPDHRSVRRRILITGALFRPLRQRSTGFSCNCGES